MGFGVEEDGATGGKHVPLWGGDSEMDFPPTTHPENASHSERRFWDATSA